MIELSSLQRSVRDLHSKLKVLFFIGRKFEFVCRNFFVTFGKKLLIHTNITDSNLSLQP